MKTSHVLSVCVAVPFSLTMLAGSALGDPIDWTWVCSLDSSLCYPNGDNPTGPCLSDEILCDPKTNTWACIEIYNGGFIGGLFITLPCIPGVPISVPPSADESQAQGACNIMCFGTVSGSPPPPPSSSPPPPPPSSSPPPPPPSSSPPPPPPSSSPPPPPPSSSPPPPPPSSSPPPPPPPPPVSNLISACVSFTATCGLPGSTPNPYSISHVVCNVKMADGTYSLVQVLDTQCPTGSSDIVINGTDFFQNACKMMCYDINMECGFDNTTWPWTLVCNGKRPCHLDEFGNPVCN